MSSIYGYLSFEPVSGQAPTENQNPKNPTPKTLNITPKNRASSVDVKEEGDSSAGTGPGAREDRAVWMEVMWRTLHGPLCPLQWRQPVLTVAGLLPPEIL